MRVWQPAGVRNRENSDGAGLTDPKDSNQFPLRVGLIVSAGLKGLWPLLLISPFLWYPLTQSLASQGGGGKVHPWLDLQQQGHLGLGARTPGLADVTSGHGREKRVKITQPFQCGPSRVAPPKNGGEKCCSAINKVASREYTINIHRYIREWASRSKPLGHSKRSGHLPWKSWEGQVGTRTPGSAKLSRPKEQEMSHTVSVCDCPKNIIRMKIHQMSSKHWLPICSKHWKYLSLLSNTYRQALAGLLSWLQHHLDMPRLWVQSLVRAHTGSNEWMHP